MCVKKHEKKEYIKRQPIFKNHDQKHFITWNCVFHAFVFYVFFIGTQRSSSFERKRK